MLIKVVLGFISLFKPPALGSKQSKRYDMVYDDLGHTPLQDANL